MEEVVVQQDNLKDGNLEVGSPIGRKNGLTLIELPRDSTAGKWRLWVADSEIMQIDELHLVGGDDFNRSRNCCSFKVQAYLNFSDSS